MLYSCELAVFVERRLCGAAAANEVPTGASAAAADSEPSSRHRGEVIPVYFQLHTVAAAA